MKTANVIHILTWLLITSFSQKLTAQLYEVPLEQRLQQSSLIIEGKVIETKSYKGNDGNIYTANKIKAFSVLKGDLQTSIVTVVSLGGTIDGEIETWTHTLTLEKDEIGLFFLKATHRPQQEETEDLNIYEVYSSSQGFLKYSENSNKIIIATAPFNNYQKHNLLETIRQKTGQFNRISQKETANIENSTGVRYSVQNVSFSGNVVDFDIYVEGLLGSYDLSRSELIIEYDPTVLGSNISSSGIISVTKGTVSNSPNYNLTVGDITPDELSIKIEALNTGLGLHTVTNLQEQLVHVQITSPNTGNANMHFDEVNMQQLSEFLNNNNVTEAFQQVFAVGGVKDIGGNILACPIITGFTPNTVAAGVDDVSLNGIQGKISISGQNFGNPSAGYIKPHLSDVLFYDVDLGWFPAGELEYISWHDTLIEVRVPTMKKAISATYTTHGASTGKIGIFKTDFVTGDTCTAYSTNSLFVQFGVFNDPWNQNIPNWEVSQGNFSSIDIQGGKNRNLVNRNGIGGYDLEIRDLYTDTIKNNAIKEQILKAIDVYRCEFKINIRDITNSTHGIILRGTLPTGVTGTTMMRASSSSNNCSFQADTASPITQFLILINKDVLDTLVIGGIGTFMFNFADTIPSDTGVVKYIDIQRTILHEFGHVLQLRHTSNQGDIMIAGKVENLKFNNFSRSLSVNDSLGIQHIYLQSKLGACGGYTGMLDYVCITSNINRGRNEINNLLIYPNPTKERIYLVANQQHSKLFVELWTMGGQKVFQKAYSNIENPLEIDLPPNLPNGLYLLRTFDEKGYVNGISKVIIQK